MNDIHRLSIAFSVAAICLIRPAREAMCAPPSPPPRANVVLIVSDDQGFGDIGWNSEQVSTPRLSRLASEGVRFDRFYANPICSVTRAALMTGMATIRTGVNNRSGLDLEYRLLPQIFRDAGYQTWMFGKWHLGGPSDSERRGPKYYPRARGFDYFYGHLHGAIDYYTHRRKDTGEIDWQRNGKPVVEKGFSTDLLVDDAIRNLKARDVLRPFLLYLPFNAVHGPLQAPPSSPSLSKRNRRELLAANVAHMDAAIGRLLDAIDDEGLRESTLILFFSDNGGQLSQGASNGELRGEKGNTFEGGIRVPAAARWPEILPAGTVSQQFVSVMDVLPTLCAAVGIDTGMESPLDGVNLWPALSQGKIADRPPFVMGNKDVACFAPPWKLVIPGHVETPLLFDVVDDPNEARDLAKLHPDVVSRLLQHVQSLGGVARRGGEQSGTRPRGDRRQGSKKRQRTEANDFSAGQKP